MLVFLSKKIKHYNNNNKINRMSGACATGLVRQRQYLNCSITTQSCGPGTGIYRDSVHPTTQTSWLRQLAATTDWEAENDAITELGVVALSLTQLFRPLVFCTDPSEIGPVYIYIYNIYISSVWRLGTVYTVNPLIYIRIM